VGRGFKPKHPEKLRGVIASAVLDRGLSVPAACRALERGDLPGWTGRYPIAYETARGYVKAEERRRHERQLQAADPATVQTAIAGQVALLLTELDRRARAVNAKTSADAIRDLARAQRELILTARACGKPGRSNGAEPGPDNASAHPTQDNDSAPDLIESLAQQNA
jgi:hypothetical protein